MRKADNPTEKQLIDELESLRQRVAELENDMADRRVVEEALKDSEERFRAIFDNLRDGLLLAEKETKKFLMGNPAIQRMLGYTEEELNRTGVTGIHPDKDLPWVLDRFEELARKEIEIARDIPVRKKDGEVFYADISSSFPMLVKGKECLMGVFRDITERKQTEEALKKERENLAEANSALKVLLEHREEDRRGLEESLLTNVKNLITPYVEKLATTQLSSDQELLLGIIESNLREIASPFLRRLSHPLVKLTPMETRVADLIRNGRTTKEIAAVLRTSARSIRFHRENIRGKLELKNNKLNLRSYLCSLA
jgi:PAS domain S-box-containing protein